jgi:hypothetical protein
MGLLVVGAVVFLAGAIIFITGKRQVDHAGDEDNYLLQYTVGPKAPSGKSQKLFFGSVLLAIGGILLAIGGVKWMLHRG